MKDKEKFECADCGCFYWVEDRSNFECPNCYEDKKELTENGYCYKNYKAFESKKGICYVPELSDEQYTYNRFVEIAKGNKDLAHTLFCIVDWQHPETLLDEFENNGHLEEYKEFN